jgi:hypothetical protein
VQSAEGLTRCGIVGDGQDGLPDDGLPLPKPRTTPPPASRGIEPRPHPTRTSRAATRVYTPRRLGGRPAPDSPCPVCRPDVITILHAARPRGSAPDVSGHAGLSFPLLEMRSRGSTHRHRSLLGSPTRPGSGRYRELVSAPVSIGRLSLVGSREPSRMRPTRIRRGGKP